MLWQAEIESEQPDDHVTALLCDSCGHDCYMDSYFIDSSEEDYCPVCYKKSQYYDNEGVEHRVMGVYSFLKRDRTHVLEAMEDAINQLEQEESYTKAFPDVFESCRKGHLDSLRFYIERGRVDVNCIDWGGNTPLQLACMFRHINVIKYLLDKGADVGLKDRLNRTAFDLIINKTLRKELEQFAWYF